MRKGEIKERTPEGTAPGKKSPTHQYRESNTGSFGLAQDALSSYGAIFLYPMGWDYPEI